MVALGLVYHTSQAQEEDCINVPIIMYHSVLNGKNGTYIVSTDVFENDMKAVISIVGKYTDDFTKTDETNSIYGHLRWKDIKELMQNGKVEFQNHTYNLHKIENGRKGIMKKKSESLEEYKEVISQDLLKLQEEFRENTGYVPNTFTYPYGAISKESTDVLKELGFKATLSCKDGINKITKNPECLYELRRYDRQSGISTEKFFENIFEN